MEMTFLVQGSAPEPYVVTFRRSEGKLTADCTCPAGVLGQACKHRLSLLQSDVSEVTSDDAPEANVLKDCNRSAYHRCIGRLPVHRQELV